MNRRAAVGKTSAWPRRSSGLGLPSPFVGRADEMSRLTAALTLAAQGRGRIVLLSGEPGIGKTRLAREALALAEERDFTALEGRAYPLGIGLAYAPFLDVFNPLLHSLDPARLAKIASDVPTLGRLFEGFGLSALESLGDPALEKVHLFREVIRLVERLALESPVAIFIDDIHYADSATLELLNYLARGLAGQRLVWITTYSAHALDTSPGLRMLVGPLLREGLADEIVIPRLEPDAVGKLVRAILGGEAPENLLDFLEAHTSGTPLFIEALISALVDSGNLRPGERGWVLNAEGVIALPSSVRHLILERLERLAPTDRFVLELIAVLGDTTWHAILRAASGLEEQSLLQSVRHLRDARLVTERTDGSEVTYSLTHPLVQEVVHGEVPEMERRRIHVMAMEALERLRPEDTRRLVRHYHGAGDEANSERALATLLAAGGQALAVYANEEAAFHFGTALAMVRRGRRITTSTGSNEPILPLVLERLGEAWERIGKREAAIEAWNEALTERKGAHDLVAASRLIARLALAESDRGHFDMANAYLAAGLATLADGEPCMELADLHFARYHVLSRLGDTSGVADTASALLSLAERLSSARVESEANLAASMSSLGQGDIATARECALHALVVSEQAQELAISCRAHSVLTAIGMRLGDCHFIRHHAERGLAMAQRLGAPCRTALFRSRMAYASFMFGEWDEALLHSREAVALARRVGDHRDLAHSLAERAIFLTFRGDLAEAKACISEVWTAFSGWTLADRHVFGLVDIAETALALESDQVNRALVVARGFIRRDTAAGVPGGLTLSYVPVGLMLLAEAQVGAGDANGALKTAAAIASLGPVGAPYMTALSSRAEGLARQALGQREAALDCFAQAHATFTALKIPFEAARSTLNWAATVGATQPELAVTSVRQSLGVFDRLGARQYVSRARRLLQDLKTPRFATSPPRIGGVPVSARELEVARLIAEGLTTAQIAEHLTLSPGTVTAHLHRIYTRLGISSRTALTRQVIEAGLL